MIKIKKFLIELKNRFFLSVISWNFSLYINVLYKDILIYVFFIDTNKIFSNNNINIIATNVSEIFETQYKLILILTNIISFLFFFFHLFIFFLPALYIKEYILLKKILKIFFFCFFFFNFFFTKYFTNNITFFFFNFYNQNKNFIEIFLELSLIQYTNYYIYIYKKLNFFFLLYLIITCFISYYYKKIKNKKKILHYILIFNIFLLAPFEINIFIIVSIIEIFFLELFFLILIIKKNFLVRKPIKS